MKRGMIRTGSNRFSVGLALATAVLLTGCTNALVDQIAEDVLVEKAGGRPKIVSQVPTADAVGVLSNTTIQVQFDMDIDEESLTDAISLYEQDGPSTSLSGATSYNPDTKTVVFTPQDPLPIEKTFRVEMSEEIENAGGATVGSAAAWSFTTVDVNPDQLRIDLSTSLTPSVSEESPFYLAVTTFPIDPNEIRLFGPYNSPTQTLLLEHEELTDNPSQEGFVFLLTHDQDNDMETNDPSWFYIDGGTGNVYPNLYNSITEFNALNPSVEANPDIEARLGSRYAIDVAATPADDFADYDSSDPTDFPTNTFTNLDAAFSEEVPLQASSRYHGEWFEFTVPAGETGQYQIKTNSDGGTIDVYHQMVLYSYDASAPSPEPTQLESALSTGSSGPTIPFATLDTSAADTPFNLVAGTTYYLSIYTFWLEAFNTPVDSGNYTIRFTKL